MNSIKNYIISIAASTALLSSCAVQRPSYEAFELNTTGLDRKERKELRTDLKKNLDSLTNLSNAYADTAQSQFYSAIDNGKLDSLTQMKILDNYCVAIGLLHNVEQYGEANDMDSKKKILFSGSDYKIFKATYNNMVKDDSIKIRKIANKEAESIGSDIEIFNPQNEMERNVRVKYDGTMRYVDNKRKPVVYVDGLIVGGLVALTVWLTDKYSE
ncbi:MAG TPA: hypothetical protein VEC16_03815 [Alphaproteobacteria bacterium]|nr:hypothetical protein [Alphaproteobacteria bacterium]